MKHYKQGLLQQQIMMELADIPEDKLVVLYDLIHYFRLGLVSESNIQAVEPTLAGCLKNYSNGYIPTDQATQQPAFFEQLCLADESTDDELSLLFARNRDN